MQRTALLSVYDKTGVIELGRALAGIGWRILSSGGTAKELAAAGVPVTEVAEYTGYPEMPGGLVKTLNPKIHAGILAHLDDQVHLDYLLLIGADPIDLVICNLYPFATDPSAGMIDIGGPAMVRAAAKNHDRVTVVVDPADYDRLLEALAAGETSPELRRELAGKAFAHTAAYDLMIAEWVSGGEYKGVLGRRHTEFKYGENGWQVPSFYYSRGTGDELAFERFEQVDGTEPSYNNVVEIADRQRQTISHIVAGFERNFDEHPLVAVVTKHGNCCGAAVGDDPEEVIKNAILGDLRAIHGGLLMTNFPITGALADIVRNWNIGDAPRRLLDAVSAPAIDEAAIDLLRRKGVQSKCRLFTNPALAHLGEHSMDQSERWRFLPGGFAIQPNYTFVLDYGAEDFEWVYGQPDEQVMRDGVLAWAIGSTSNSNTITLVRGNMLIANGTGQQDRVTAAKLALARAAEAGHAGRLAEWQLRYRLPEGPLPVFEVERAAGGASELVLRFQSGDGYPRLAYRFEGWDKPPRVVAYTDSYFPFPDGVEALLGAGIWTVVGTHGSVHDREVEDAFLQVGLLGWQPDGLARGFGFH